MCQRDLRLGCKHVIFQHTPLQTTPCIAHPILGKTKLISDGNAARLGGKRQTVRHLAVILLATLAAILTRHPNGVFALLRKARVVDYPVASGVRAQRWLHPVAHCLEHCRV